MRRTGSSAPDLALALDFGAASRGLSAASLPSTSSRNTACRISPPPVRPRYSISADRTGSTQRTPLGGAVSSFSGAVLVRKGSRRCHSSRALASVKPEPQWPTGISVLPAYSPSTSAPTAFGSTVEGTKPAITKLSLWLDFTFSQVFTRPER